MVEIPAAAAPEPAGGDDHEFLCQLNRAQLVVLHEMDLLPRGQVRAIARAMDEMARAEAVRTIADYLEYERELIERVGPEGSNLHLGRSRNDLGATRERMWLRREALAVTAELVACREELLAACERYATVVIPSYTHAVQAQPITLGHYLLALDGALTRDGERLEAGYGRIDQSPLGAGALATSGFGLDRGRLASLLGFSALCDNSYDCIGIAAADVKIELAGVLATSGVAIGRFCQDLVAQQADPAPGITVGAELTGGSSIMPQKRNPSVLEALRGLCSELAGDAQAVLLVAHNTPFGDVADVRGVALRRTLRVTAAATRMYGLLARLLAGLVVDPERCRRLVERDFSTMTELSDVLYREAGVPFRVGHRVARELTDFGRATARAPAELTYAEVSRIYHGVVGDDLPIDEATYRGAVDPAAFVQSRRGRGGPQSAEVTRMIAEHRRDLAGLRDRLRERRRRLRDADQELDRAYARCRDTGGDLG